MALRSSSAVNCTPSTHSATIILLDAISVYTLGICTWSLSEASFWRFSHAFTEFLRLQKKKSFVQWPILIHHSAHFQLTLLRAQNRLPCECVSQHNQISIPLASQTCAHTTVKVGEMPSSHCSFVAVWPVFVP